MGYRLRGFLVVGGVTLASVALFGLPAAPAWGDRDGARGEVEREGGGRLSRWPTQTNTAWRTECASCHVAYPPGMLPKASWARIMSGLDAHFGENAGLPPQTAAEIADFLARNALDAGRSGTSETGAPIRISETAWFRREHREVGATVWKRPAVGGPANCVACHREADKGLFNEHGVKIPQ